MPCSSNTNNTNIGASNNNHQDRISQRDADNALRNHLSSLTLPRSSSSVSLASLSSFPPSPPAGSTTMSNRRTTSMVLDTLNLALDIVEATPIDAFPSMESLSQEDGSTERDWTGNNDDSEDGDDFMLP